MLREAVEAADKERTHAAQQAARTPSLSSAKTEYERFFAETGGPIEISGLDSNQSNFKFCCDQLRRQKFLPLVKRWQNDNATGIRHWPHMAVASFRFRYQQQRFAKEGAEPSGREVAELIARIKHAASELTASITSLMKISGGTSDGYAPSAIPHVRWIDRYIAQAAAGIPSKDVKNDRPIVVHVEEQRAEFLRRIVAVQAAAATVLATRLDANLLKQPKRGEIRELLNLVRDAKLIWPSLTGRPPSVGKIANKESTDFSEFVMELARIGGGPIPTSKQIKMLSSARKASPIDFRCWKPWLAAARALSFSQ